MVSHSRCTGFVVDVSWGFGSYGISVGWTRSKCNGIIVIANRKWIFLELRLRQIAPPGKRFDGHIKLGWLFTPVLQLRRWLKFGNGPRPCVALRRSFGAHLIRDGRAIRGASKSRSCMQEYIPTVLPNSHGSSKSPSCRGQLYLPEGVRAHVHASANSYSDTQGLWRDIHKMDIEFFGPFLHLDVDILTDWTSACGPGIP